jgi:hypothetical protein
MPLRDFLAFLHASKLLQAAEGHAAAGGGGAGSGRLDADAVAAARCSPPVPYLQFQNSSLTAELPQLLADIDPQLSWATEAFGAYQLPYAGQLMLLRLPAKHRPC